MEKKKNQIENKIDAYLCFEGTISLLFLVKTYFNLVLKELKNKKIVWDDKKNPIKKLHKHSHESCWHLTPKHCIQMLQNSKFAPLLWYFLPTSKFLLNYNDQLLPTILSINLTFDFSKSIIEKHVIFRYHHSFFYSSQR